MHKRHLFVVIGPAANTLTGCYINRKTYHYASREQWESHLCSYRVDHSRRDFVARRTLHDVTH